MPPDAFDGGGIAMCGSDICLDLAHPANAGLANVDGIRVLAAPSDKLIVIRTAATPPAFVVLSRVCTHSACIVIWDSLVHELKCPCHGSRFDIDGRVTRDPATRSLRKYGSTFDQATQTLTIKLA